MDKYCLFCDRQGTVIFPGQHGLPGLAETKVCLKCGHPLFTMDEMTKLKFMAYLLDRGHMLYDQEIPSTKGG